MDDQTEGSRLGVRIALALAVTVLPAALVIGTGMAFSSERAPIWQFALQLCVFVMGGSVALVLALIANERVSNRSGPLARLNRWSAAAVYTAVILAMLIWRDAQSAV